MKKEVRSWKNVIGKLERDPENGTWQFTSKIESWEIFITPWKITEKGAMTEIFLKDSEREKEIIIEIIEDSFNDEIFAPMNPTETAEKIMNLCNVMKSVDTKVSEYSMEDSLCSVAKRLLREELFKNSECIHVYYENGLSFGIERDECNKMKKVESIPERCMEFPGTRFDSVAD